MGNRAVRRAGVAVVIAVAISGGVGACNAVLGIGDFRISVCQPGDKGCRDDTTPETCGTDGQWHDESACVNQACSGGECVGRCAPGARRCADNTPETCDARGQWQNGPTPPCEAGLHCSGGACVGVMCTPADVQCRSESIPQTCDASGQWQDRPACAHQDCWLGECTGPCALRQMRCSIDHKTTPQGCDEQGSWKDLPACLGPCVAGSCPGPSCAGLSETCGPGANESCCLSPAVTGGTYNRSDDPSSPATVSDFRLDRFEITVGRFRAFVEAYPLSKPAADAGAHPLIAGSGWRAAWDMQLPPDKAALMDTVSCNAVYQTWTDTVGVNEDRPMNCISWYDAFAFCAWDGGRLPTEAEWNFAAAGGSEQRVYPWSSPASSEKIDATYAVYSGAEVGLVGSKSTTGDGKWGQADLAGNVEEWNLDWLKDTYLFPACDNCADLMRGSVRVIRGGSLDYDTSHLRASSRYGGDPSFRGDLSGARCARSP